VRKDASRDVSGEFTTIGGERYYAIRNVDAMAPFFMSLISSVDHWLFISSTGGLTAGRVSPKSALFPYLPVDRIHESTAHTGCVTVVRGSIDGQEFTWHPFNRERTGASEVRRNLYKNVLGNRLCFEEINHDLQLAFRYTWTTSDEYGFLRHCEIENLGDESRQLSLLDGLRNILPAGAPSHIQATASNLVDAYKWTELDEATGLAVYSLYSAISDRAEPCESLRANVVYALWLQPAATLLSADRVDDFCDGALLTTEAHTRGVRGAYLVTSEIELEPRARQEWLIVADVEKSQADVMTLQQQLQHPSTHAENILQSTARGADELARIVAAADGAQTVAEEVVAAHHSANVLFNVLRGGIFDDQYRVSTSDLAATIEHFNRVVHRRNETFFRDLPDTIAHCELLGRVRETGDVQLERLCLEYLPITFGRRHGDPSRPWNFFTIKLKDAQGNRRLFYEGNWRDVFQNWEALALSYPEFTESIIAKFVNASTADGYNPYRITKDGIDWEVEEKDDPWSYIGYWGDHQIIYLQKLLELSRRFHPDRLGDLLHRPVFSYANVPYRIRPFDDIVANSKATVDFDHELADLIEQAVVADGADAKLLRDADGNVCQVTLLEKLLVTLLCKIGNTVVDGGVWMNTQRPEWNDANNALVGHGVSMVTLYYMRRYVAFLRALLADDTGEATLSADVADWLIDTANAVKDMSARPDNGRLSPEQRFAALRSVGQAAGRYRSRLYANGLRDERTQVPMRAILGLLDQALVVIDHSIDANQRDDGLYHAYNLADFGDGTLDIDTLYPMLEGQVAALSSGELTPEQSVAVIEALFASSIFRPDQHSFMLYPDRELPGFLDKNRIPAEAAASIPVLQRMLDDGVTAIVLRDPGGALRFHPDCVNVDALNHHIDRLLPRYGSELDEARPALQQLYETVFRHRAFTGRSGTMFGFEGLGCIYWHMVSKLLLAVQENFIAAADNGVAPETVAKLGELYYRVRAGISFNKTPAEYGAFPADPYSHTPGHAGASQPGMTGSVKEEVLTRFGELGLRVADGAIRVDPGLLRRREFLGAPGRFCYVDVDGKWQTLDVPDQGLAFTWCQVPVVYVLEDGADAAITLARNDGSSRADGLSLSADVSRALFGRTGEIRQIIVHLPPNLLFDG
jgi:hypothetical protein